MANKKINYDAMPQEFKHLSKIEQSRLIHMAENVAKKLKKLPPEVMDNMTRKMSALGQEEAPIDDFSTLFDNMLKEAEDAMEKDRIDRSSVKKMTQENKPKSSIRECNCDFLPNLPMYKNVTCSSENCCRK